MTIVLQANGGQYNRKSKQPSENMLESDGAHYRCAWIEDSVTFHSDGNISCGLDDPHGQRSFGNIYTQSVQEIFGNPEYDKLQRRLWDGHRCRDCGHFRAEANPSASINRRPPLPTRIVVETTVTCNIRCPNLPCLANNDPHEVTRDSRFLDVKAFRKAIGQIGAGLKTVNFYNYGEPFMHRQAEEMLLHLRAASPSAFIVTSTNGIPLSKYERAESLVKALPNRVTFTIGGATQETYSRYHVNGRLAQALLGLKNVCEAKRRAQQSLPEIVWRYLAFHWNDSDEEIDRAIGLAHECGVDRFSLYLTNTPPGARSVRLSPGSPAFWKYRKYLHIDHEGELNHIYRSELPDEQGFYPPEKLRALGWAKWTSSRAQLRLRPERGVLHLVLSTNREQRRKRDQMCTVRLPWGAFEVAVKHGVWNESTFKIPFHYRRLQEHEAELIVEDHWFPSSEIGSKDLRCLGVLIAIENPEVRA